MTEPPAVRPAPDDLSRLAGSGALVLATRQVVALGVTVVGGVWLARLLSPADFGYYAVALLLLAMSTTVAEGGIGVSLVRKQADPSAHELRTAFTVQLVVALVLALVGYVAVRILQPRTGLPDGGAHLIQLALIVPVIAAFKAVPVVRLERQLRFGIIGVASTLEVVTFNVVSVALAGLGAGVVSMGVGLVAGAVLGATWMNVRAPWAPRLGIAPETREHLRYGIPYQGVSAVSLAKDSISPLMIGLVAGATGVGLAEWAQRLAAYAILALFILQRLLLSWFARLQHDRERLDDAVRLALLGAYGVVAPLSVMTLVFAHPITAHVFGTKWEPGLSVYWWLWVANLFVPASVVAMAGLNALGQSRLTFRFAVLWAVLTWVFGLPLISMVGIAGYGVANVLVQVSNFWFFAEARRRFAFPWLRSALLPWLASAVAGSLGSLAWWQVDVSPIPRLVVGCGTLLLVYAALVVSRRDVRAYAHRSRGGGAR